MLLAVQGAAGGGCRLDIGHRGGPHSKHRCAWPLPHL